MTAENVASGSGDPQHLIDLRLDAIDRTLLGLLPRNERLETVARIEARIRELAGADSAVAAILTEPEPAAVATPARASRKRRSRLALAAGVLGIVSLALLVAAPITYVLAALLEELTSEWLVVGLLSTHVLAVAVAGTLAVILGLTAIFRLSRSSPALAGHGWAITGLCTGPLPMLVGGLLVLIVGSQLLSESMVSVTVSAPATPVSNQQCSTCQMYAAPAEYPALAPPLPATDVQSSANLETVPPLPAPAASQAPNALPGLQPLTEPDSRLPLAESRSSLPAGESQPVPPVPTATSPPVPEATPLQHLALPIVAEASPTPPPAVVDAAPKAE